MTTSFRFLVTLLFLAVGTWLAVSGSGREAEDNQQNKDNPNKEKKKVEAEPLKGENIPLESVHFLESGIRKGPKWELALQVDKSLADDLNAIRSGEKSPCLFLVRAEDIRGAVKITGRYFTKGGQLDAPMGPEKDSKKLPLWVVVYFGRAQSDPTNWVVRSVVKAKTKVQVAFEIPSLYIRSTDIRPYVTWIPLGQLEGGMYTLEAFDVKKKQVTLSQRVGIPMQ